MVVEKKSSNLYENKYHFLIDNILDVVGELDLNGIFTYVNPYVYKELGYQPKEMIGRELYEFVHPDDIKKLVKIFHKSSKSDDLIAEVRVQKKNNQYLWFKIEAKRTIDHNNQKKILITFKNINNFKLLKKKIKESEEKYRTLVEKSLQGMCILQDVKIVFANNALAEILGYSVKELYSLSPEDVVNLIYIDDRDFVFNRHRERLSGKKVPSHYEFRIIRKDNQIRWVDIFATLIEYGEKLAVQEVFVDITDKKNAEQKLKESEEKYRLITENANDLIVVINKNFRYEYVNEQVHKKLMGYSKEDLIGKSSLVFVHPDDIEEASKTLKDGFDIGEGVGEVRIRNKKGDYIWLEIKGKTYIDRDSKKKGLLISRDVTNRKIAEEKLKESEKKYRNLIENAHEGVWAVDENNNTIFVNPKICEMLGYTKDEMMGKNLSLFLEDPMKKVINSYRKRRKKGLKDTYELDFIKKDRTLISTSINAAPILNENGEFKGSFAYINDITNRKIAEQKLKESKEKYRSLVDNISDVIVKGELDGTITYVSSQVFDIFGYRPEELIGLKAMVLIHPEDLTIFAEKLKESKNTVNTVSAEVRARHKGGHYLYISTKGRMIKEAGEAKLISVIRDITKRKLAEQKWKVSEEKYRLITENANDLIIVLDNKFNIVYINELPFYKMLGYHSIDFIGKRDFKLIQPDDQKRILKELTDGYEKGEGITETRIKHKDGRYIWVEARGKTFVDKNGKIKILINVRNLTDRKKAMEKLKESERKYRQLIEDSLEGVWVIDSKSITTLVNPSMAKMIGYTTDEIIGKSVFSFMDENEAKIARKQIENRKKGISAERDSVMIHKNGNKIFIKLRATPIFDEEGNYKGIMAFISDITKRKQAELKLKESEKRYRSLFDISPIGIGISNMEGNVITLNHRMEEITGYSKDDFKNISLIDTYVSINKRIELLSKLKESGRVRNFELRLKKKDGVIYDALLNIDKIEMDGQTVILTTCQDITSIKNIEKKLIESERKYRNLIETSSMGLMEIDISKGGFVYINPRLLEIVGFTQEELLRNGMFYKAIYPDGYKKVTKSDEDKDIELRIINKEGKIKWLSGRTLHNYNEQGELIYLRLWLQDITEAKELEEIKSNLLTRISHEFKTPLISIKGFTDLLLTEHRGSLNQQTINFLERIKEGGEKLKLLINRFIETTQLDKQLVKLNRSHENLSNLIKKVIAEMEGLIKLRNHIINIDIPDELIMYLDEVKIQTVISNLLTNAIKYTPSGGNITINSRIKKNTLIISVRDDGIGLHKEEIAQLFKPFGKIEKYGRGWDIISEGIGLGLYLSKEIIDLHNGEVWVESGGLNKGSNFYFSLPIIPNNKNG